ncbi:MAG: hypothetical protein C9356_18135 [Oleiphilus sp.]|nr:MAG: hypothetical protein C9356_18135 [Oleiphilus sp.]
MEFSIAVKPMLGRSFCHRVFFEPLKGISFRLFFGTLCWAMLSASASAASDTDLPRPEIHLSTAIIAPYQQLGEQGELEGFAIPVVECLMAKLGFDYKIEVFPWLRAQKNVESGESDAFFVASQSSERDRYAQQSSPLFSGTRSWYLREGFELEPHSEAFRQEAMVGTVFGTNMHRKLEQEFQHVVTKTTEEDLLQLLHLGRLDGVLLTDLMFEYTIGFMSMEHHAFTRVLARQKPLGVYFSHVFLEKHPGFMARFNASIPECKRSVVIP